MAVKDENSKQSCLLGCAIAGAIAGVVLAAALFIVMGYGSAASIFLGGLAAVILAVLMMVVFCRELPAPIDQGVASASPSAKPSEPKPAASAASVTAAAPAAAPAVKKPTAKPVAKPAAKPATTAKPKSPAKPKAAAKPADDGRPAGLKKARGGRADNLKEIKGVGPKLEKMLNGMGYYHFDQIASWKKKEVAWVDENLEGFKGRVSRDEWVKQAKILAKGGETEFSKRVDKGDVY
ncbi:MAG: hypothetical protein AAF280_10580 [Pseudomonadota bacterium]